MVKTYSIRMVADVTDPGTRKVISSLWNDSPRSLRKKLLDDMGHSEKWAEVEFNDLTGEIQSKIYTEKAFIKVKFK